MHECDRDLVQSVLRGDSDAFEDLYDRYAGIVRAICFEVTGNVNEARDLCQEVFLRAYRRLATLKDPACFGPWIVGIARLAGRHWRRTRARDRHRWIGAATDDAVMDDAVQPSEAMASQERSEALHAALVELSAKERMAIHLFYLQDQPAEQARSLLGLSTSGFYRLLERARDKLRQRLLQTEEFKP